MISASVEASLSRSWRRSTIMSIAPFSIRNSARWNPSGSFSRTVCSMTRGPAKPMSALGSAMTTSPIMAKLAERGLPYISVFTHPTMGGVSASLSMLGDIHIAEPKALIGFAGPRVIEQTVRQKLPEGFQRAEFLLEKGAIDMIVDRRQLRDKLHAVLSLLQGMPAETPA